MLYTMIGVCSGSFKAISIVRELILTENSFIEADPLTQL